MSLVIVMLYHIPQGGPQLTPRNGEIQMTFPRLVHVQYFSPMREKVSQ
jgi:hypothetical protein